jgi:hypothetical protein
MWSWVVNACACVYVCGCGRWDGGVRICSHAHLFAR